MRTFLRLLPALLLCLRAPPGAGAAPPPTAQEILRGEVLPADWDDAPAAILIPPEWVRTIGELYAETVATDQERGACVAYGRPQAAQLSFSRRFIDLSKVYLDAHLAEGQGEKTKAEKLRKLGDSLSADLLQEAGSEAGFRFEIQRVSSGISGSVHIPPCVGSQYGTIHTHPKDSAAMPSDGDVSSSLYDYAYRGGRMDLVALGEDAAMMLVTEEFRNTFSPLSEASTIDDETTKSLLAALRKRILAMITLSGPRDAQWLATIGGLYAVELKSYGVALYAGKLPDLRKVAPAADYRNGWLSVSAGAVKPVRSGTSNVRALALNLVGEPLKRQGDIMKDLARRGGEIGAMSDDLYLQALGQLSKQRDIRSYATSSAQELDVGACVKWVENGLRYYPGCLNSFAAGIRAKGDCTGWSRDNPMLEWTFDEGAPTRLNLVSGLPGDARDCAYESYGLSPQGEVQNLVDSGKAPKERFAEPAGKK